MRLKPHQWMMIGVGGALVVSFATVGFRRPSRAGGPGPGGQSPVLTIPAPPGVKPHEDPDPAPVATSGSAARPVPIDPVRRLPELWAGVGGLLRDDAALSVQDQVARFRDQERTAGELAAFGDASVAFLRERLRDPDADMETRRWILSVIGRIPGPRAMEVLLDVLRSGTDSVLRTHAAGLLKAYDDPAVAAAIESTLAAEPAMEGRYALVAALAATRRPEALPALESILARDADAPSRGQAAAGLAGFLPGPEARRALLRAAGADADPSVRLNALRALAEDPDEETVAFAGDRFRSETDAGIRAVLRKIRERGGLPVPD